MLYLLAAVAGFVLGAWVCFVLMWKLAIQVAKNKDRRIAMFRSYFYTLDRWLNQRRQQHTLGEWLARTKQVHRVALYGVGVLGRQFVEELATGPVSIVYAIDRNASDTKEAFPVYTLSDALPPAEMVIVTPAYDFETIRAELSRQLHCPIISAESLIEEFGHDAS